MEYEYIKDFFDWFWALRSDGLITSWGKGNMIIIGLIVALINVRVKRTQSTVDDEQWAAIKRRLGLE